MRTKILVLSLALVLSAGLHAQVTIGGLTAPKAGALLDLNSTIQGGLVLSNVNLPDLSVIPGGVFVGISAAQDRNQELAGMIVYNTDATTGVGVHVWDGDDWIKLCAPPTPGAITFSGSSFCTASQFTAKIDSVKGATNYVWTLPPGLTGTSNDTIITITGATAGVYPAGSITVRAESSCGGGTRRASEQAVTVVEILPAPTGATANSRCGAGAVTFGATVPTGITIDWYDAPTGGSIVSGGAGTTSFSPSLTATTTYYAQARNTTTGCVSDTRLPVTGTVNTVSAPTGATANSRCGAGAVTFGATVPTGITIDWYTAATGGSIVSGGAGTTSFSPSLTATTTYYAQARNTTTSCTSASRLAVTGTINALSAVPTGATANSRCGAGAVTFGATVPTGITIDWYTADTGGSIVSDGEGTTSFSPSLTDTKTYYAQARNMTTGCTSASRLAVTGTVYTAVSKAVISGASSNTCPAINVALIATATGATSYTWYKGGSQVQNSTSNAYTVTETGVYTVKGDNANCTGATSNDQNVTINDCGNVPGCPNLTVLTTNWGNDGYSDWHNSNDLCKSRGGKLPSVEELQCLCAHHANVPGGIDDLNWYWSRTPASNGKYYKVDCTQGLTTAEAASGVQIRCVQ
jgi:hypothetical protein